MIIQMTSFAHWDLPFFSISEIKKAITADGENGFLYTINGQFPGPTLTVYEGQEVAVKVTNSLYQESTYIFKAYFSEF